MNEININSWQRVRGGQQKTPHPHFVQQTWCLTVFT